MKENDPDMIPLGFCDTTFESEEDFKEHKSSVYTSNSGEADPKFKYDLCDYDSKSKKGGNIH